jgi:trk system potassium uptake protein TrkA
VFVLIVGAGRVGSTVAKRAIQQGHEVSVLDEDPLSHERLEDPSEGAWEDRGGRFTVGTALELEALRDAGIEQAEVFVASTNGDNTNLVIAQIAKRRFEVPRVVARVLDPARAEWYASRGIEIVSPTQTAIDLVTSAALGPVES